LESTPERAVKAAFMARSDSDADNPGMAPFSNRCIRGLGRLGAVVLTLLLGAAAHASGDGDRGRDHERARAAVQAGQVLPLATLLLQVQRSHPGQVLEVELERDDGRWVYELKLLHSGGRLLKLELDAATGQVLRARGKAAGQVERPPRPASAPASPGAASAAGAPGAPA
jgi:hypothetical protein